MPLRFPMVEMARVELVSKQGFPMRNYSLDDGGFR